MGLITVISQDYQILLDRWLQNIRSDVQTFGPHQIRVVVPNHRMATWLNRSLAQKWSISMNLKFLYFDSLLEEWASDLSDGVSRIQSGTSLTLHWASLLFEALEDSDFHESAGFALSSVSHASPFQRMQLAWEFALLFQQYAEYRPRWLQLWQDGFSVPELDFVPQAHFQARLYRYLVSKQAQPHPLFHILKTHRNQVLKFKQSATLHCFGFWSFTPSAWSILQRITTDCEAFLYLPFPTETYLADLTKTNLNRPLLLGDEGLQMGPNYQLLAKLGRKGRSMQIQLLDSDIQTEEYWKPLKLPKNSRLYSLQRQLSAPDHFIPEEILPSSDQDPSIQIHSVCSLRREVEVVKMLVQKALSEIPNLELEGIHIHAPDIRPYAPLVTEIFQLDAHHSPIAFSIQNAIDGDKVSGIRVVMDLIKLVQSDWDYRSIIEWLSLEPVSEAFGLSQQSIDQFREWIAEAGIFRGNPVSPRQEHHFWKPGIQRLIQAYAGEIHLNPLGERPYSKHPPHQHGETFAKLCDCYSFLEGLAHQIAGRPESPSWYRSLIVSLVNKVLSSNHEFEKQVLLGTVNRLVEQLPCDIELDPTTFLYLIRKALPKLPPPQLLSRKTGIQFSSIQNEDLLPCQVRILMGMNETDFPSLDIPQSFNLIQYGENEPGDPSRKEDQRYWVLQSLQQTTERWMVTYQGQDATGNASRLISPVVDAVLNAVNRLAVSSSDGNQNESYTVNPVQHPRFAYEPGCFGDDPMVRHFSDTDYHIANNLMQTGEFRLPEVHRQTSVHGVIEPSNPEVFHTTIWELGQFFSHPNRYVCKQTFGFEIPDPRDYSVEHEPLLWAGMGASHTLKLDLLRSAALGLPESDVRRILEGHHALLSGDLETIGKDLIQSEISGLKKAADRSDIQLLENLDLTLCVTTIPDDFTLTHAQIFQLPVIVNMLGTVRSSSLSARYRLEAWIHALGLWLNQTPETRRNFILIAADNTFQLQPPSDPLGILGSLLEVFRDYKCQAVPFFPATSEKLVKRQIKLSVIDQNESWAGKFGENRDPYIEYMFRNRDPFTDEFERLARLVWEPLLQQEVGAARKGGKS